MIGVFLLSDKKNLKTQNTCIQNKKEEVLSNELVQVWKMKTFKSSRKSKKKFIIQVSFVQRDSDSIFGKE